MTSDLFKLKWLKRRHLPLLLQTEATECGLACLAMVAAFHGFITDLGTLRRRYAISLRGASLKQIMDIATRMGFNPRPLRFEIQHLKNLQLPAILHWDMNHFVVLKSTTKKMITIHDPAFGEKKLSIDEASKHMTGVVLELTPSKDFTPKKEQTKARIRDFWIQSGGLKRALLHVLILSLIMQVFILASPLYMQLAIDEVIMKQDIDLLVVLLIGFALLHIIHLTARSLRGYLLLHIGSLLSFQIINNLFRHLIHLPMTFFEKRHIGDIMSRFESTEPVKKLLTEDLIAGLVDGGMAMTTLVMMYIYSPVLTGIVLSATVLYVLSNFLMLNLYRERTSEVIIAAARKNSFFMESVRSMQSIKLFGREQARENVWQHYYAEVINSGFRLGKINISYDFARTFFSSIETLLVVYMGAKAILNAELTIGMLLAFVSYKTYFTDRMFSVIQKLLDLRMLDLHLQRTGDIIHSSIEEKPERLTFKEEKISGSLALEDLAFSYANDEASIFTDLHLDVKAGEFIAITGPSGSGKTTLLKLMCSLLKPTQGQIKIDGYELGNFGVGNFRDQIGAVMQEDTLLSGTISDNICFFDDHPDFEKIYYCAQLACIHEDIMRTPMQYMSLIGDMGSFLSGGQKQRILLARALYRSPKILFIDEGTSHLDIATEREVNKNLKQLNITRIFVAHRPETIKLADRVVVLTSNRLAEIDKTLLGFADAE